MSNQIKDLSNNTPKIIGFAFVFLAILGVVLYSLFGPEPTQKAQDFVLLGGPSNQNPLIHAEFLKRFNVNLVPGYEKMGTSDMKAYKPKGGEGNVDYTGIDGAQFGSVESNNMRSMYPDGIPASDGNKTILFSEVAFTSPAGFMAKKGDWDELLRVGVTVLEGNSAFLPPQNMSVIIMAANGSNYWHNICNVNGVVSLVKRENDSDPRSKALSVVTVNASGQIVTENQIPVGASTNCLNITRQVIIKFASGGSSGGKKALEVWAMYQPYNPDCTPNTSIIPGSSPTKDWEVACIAPSLKTLVANSGMQDGNSLLVIKSWATSPFKAEVLAFGYTNALISVAYNDIREGDRERFLDDNRVIYLYNTLNSEHEWVCFTQACVDLYQQMKADEEFMKIYAKVTGFNIGYDQVPEPQAKWQITTDQFGLISIVPNPAPETTKLILEALK